MSEQSSEKPKTGGFGIMFIIMILSLGVAALWTDIPLVKSSVHFVLDPSVGALLNWNATIGLLLATAIITLITTILQKYLTDQDLLKSIKEEQKIVQQELRLVKGNQEKSMELSKKSMELTMKAMPMTMRPAMYTIIPFVLFLRWFNDYFTAKPVHILGFITWFWAYLIFSLIFSAVFRKLLKVH
jgi:uncharacterized membrane protein (DUF106 family)